MSYRAGAPNGLKLILNIQQAEYLLQSTGSLAAGFRVSTQLQNTTTCIHIS